jgi:hypothetical protein
MDRNWYERLRGWQEITEQSLRRKWWLWPLLFAIDLFWHRVYGAVSEYLDSRSDGMSSAAKAILGRIPTDPITLAVVFSLVIIVVLMVHAYFDTRTTPDRTVRKPLSPIPGSALVPFTTPPPGMAPLPTSLPKLTIRVVDAVATTRLLTSFSQPETFVMMRLRVVNTRQPAVTVKTWNLELKKPDGSDWVRAYEWRPQGKVSFKRPMPMMGKEPEEESIGCQFRERTSTVPLDLGVAEEGWAVFRVTHPTLCHLFTATFVITAIDDLNEESTKRLPPGEWLTPVELVAFS